MSSLPVFKPRTDDDRRQHPYCLDCKAKCVTAGKDWNQTIKHCHGIYSEEDYQEKSDETGLPIDDVRTLLDAAEWIYKNIGFLPYWYQHRTLKCTSIRKCLRWGRRSGKTDTISAYVLYVAFTNAGKKILCVTPHKSQVKEINDRIWKFLHENPELEKDVVRSVQTPYYEIVFANNSRIRFFVAGSASGTHAGSQVRGQEADLIFIDEMDYLDDDAAGAILPILSDPDRQGDPVEFISSTTPTGRESIFFHLCHNDEYKEFHFPAHSRPDWNEEKEAEARNLARTNQRYEQEYDASWSTKADGVFRRADILDAMQPYRYYNDPGYGYSQEWPEMKPYPSHWNYIMGTDWNGPGNGTRIAIVGYDPTRHKWIQVYREAVSVDQFSLSYSIQKMVELNRIWRCKAVYIDSGFGQMQDETLRAIGRKAKMNMHQGRDYDPADLVWEDLKAVNFGGHITYKTTEEGKEIEVKVPTKNYMVENFQRFFENKDFWFSKNDEELKSQLLGYTIARQSAQNYPIYKPDHQAGDHDLDATMLALFGFNQEYSPEFQKRTHLMDFDFISHHRVRNREPVVDPLSMPVEHKQQQQRQEAEKPAKKYEVPARSIQTGRENIHIQAANNQLVVFKYRDKPGSNNAMPKSRTAGLRGKSGKR